MSFSGKVGTCYITSLVVFTADVATKLSFGDGLAHHCIVMNFTDYDTKYKRDDMENCGRWLLIF